MGQGVATTARVIPGEVPEDSFILKSIKHVNQGEGKF